MNSNARIIYKSYMTYFHTFFPVYFYGMPNGKIVAMYATYSDLSVSENDVEFVFAEHEDFVYDYANDKIFLNRHTEIDRADFKNLVDRPEQRTKIFYLTHDLKSYADAEQFLSRKSHPRLDYFVMEQMF